MSPDPLPQATAQHLRDLLRRGLPLTDTTPTAHELLNLRTVAANQPDNRASRIRALDTAVRRQLAQLDHPRWTQAARILFGATRDSTGRTLTDRRAQAAEAAGYDAHHFRKHIEPWICDRLAAMLNADGDTLHAAYTPPPLAAGRNRLRLPADVFAWEAAEHEQALAALWSDVFALRAALLRCALAAAVSGPDHDDTAEAARTALWRLALLLADAASYRAAYGPRLLGTAPDADPADLAALAGWQPPLADPDALARAAADHPGRADFLTTDAAHTARPWCDALAGHTAPDPEGEQ